MKIIKAKKEQIKDLAKVEMSSGYHKDKFNFEPYLQELFKDNTKIFCAKNKNKIVGYITLSNNGEISFLAVSKRFQGRGIANSLIRKVISSARNKQIKKLYLDVRNNNFSAIRLYLRNSFIVTKVYKKRIKNKEIVKIRMERDLI